MTIARNHTDRDDRNDFTCAADFALFLRSITPERYEDCRDDERRDAWEGDSDWAEDFGYEGESDWEDYSAYLDDEDDDDWCDQAESSDCADPTIF